jgi:hypothetical protein
MAYDEQSIINELIDQMEVTMNDVLITSVVDETRAGLIRAGKLQDDPTITQINLLIHRGKEEWPDVLKMDTDPFYSPVYEIGGVQWWWRRFIIEMSFFFDGEIDRAVARNKGNIVLPRAQKSLINLPMPQGVDDFGESCHGLQIRKAWLSEGGGEGEFIWRGEIWVEVLTSIRD